MKSHIFGLLWLFGFFMFFFTSDCCNSKRNKIERVSGVMVGEKRREIKIVEKRVIRANMGQVVVVPFLFKKKTI